MLIGRLFSTKRSFWQRVTAGWNEFKKKTNDDGLAVIESDKICKDEALIIVPKKVAKRMKGEKLI